MRKGLCCSSLPNTGLNKAAQTRKPHPLRCSCVQIERPLNKDDFTKLVQKTLQIKLAPSVVDIIFAVFGNDQGLLDGPGFVAVMKSRNRVPGYKVRPAKPCLYELSCC